MIKLCIVLILNFCMLKKIPTVAGGSSTSLEFLGPLAAPWVRFSVLRANKKKPGRGSSSTFLESLGTPFGALGKILRVAHGAAVAALEGVVRHRGLEAIACTALRPSRGTTIF